MVGVGGRAGPHSNATVDRLSNRVGDARYAANYYGRILDLQLGVSTFTCVLARPRGSYNLVDPIVPPTIVLGADLRQSLPLQAKDLIINSIHVQKAGKTRWERGLDAILHGARLNLELLRANVGLRTPSKS
jgi:hypothetical protein